MKKRRKKNTRLFEDSRILDENSNYLMQEDYKTLRTNITLSFTGNESRIIAVTGANQGDGKSTNAVNLARSLFEMGKKVLLVDCDMRRPSIAARLKLDNTKGLSGCLTGDAGLHCSAQKDEKGMYVMPAGPIPPDPIRLLQSEEMKLFIDEAKSDYEYIILDLPPVNMVSDALSVSPLVDGYLLVVRHGSTTRSDIQEMLSKMEMSKAEILGFLYANVPSETGKKYKYYEY